MPGGRRSLIHAWASAASVANNWASCSTSKVSPTARPLRCQRRVTWTRRAIPDCTKLKLIATDASVLTAVFYAFFVPVHMSIQKLVILCSTDLISKCLCTMQRNTNGLKKSAFTRAVMTNEDGQVWHPPVYLRICRRGEINIVCPPKETEIFNTKTKELHR